jgi:hypothetical protein
MSNQKKIYSLVTILSTILMAIFHYAGFAKMAFIFLIATVMLAFVGCFLWEYGSTFKVLYNKVTGNTKLDDA